MPPRLGMASSEPVPAARAARFRHGRRRDCFSRNDYRGTSDESSTTDETMPVSGSDRKSVMSLFSSTKFAITVVADRQAVRSRAVTELAFCVFRRWILANRIRSRCMKHRHGKTSYCENDCPSIDCPCINVRVAALLRVPADIRPLQLARVACRQERASGQRPRRGIRGSRSPAALESRSRS